MTFALKIHGCCFFHFFGQRNSCLIRPNYHEVRGPFLFGFYRMRNQNKSNRGGFSIFEGYGSCLCHLFRKLHDADSMRALCRVRRRRIKRDDCLLKTRFNF